MQRKVCVVTGSRAEYGLLYWVMKEIQNDPELELQIIATGMHLSPEFGLTYKVIEADGFHIDAKVEMLLSSDTPVGIAKSVGLGVIGFADVFERLKPDVIVLLGDRFEILAAAQSAMLARIPIAHIAGGDTTEGAFDEAIRHSITKMSHVHFVTNLDAARRIRQLGENTDHIHLVGSPGLDHIKRLPLKDRKGLERDLGFEFKQRNLMVTFHPATLEPKQAVLQFQELLLALDSLGDDVGIIMTKANADAEGRQLIAIMDEFAATRSNVKAFTSLGQLRYLSALAQVDAVVGNSSSGLYEAPSFKIPTINIGDRQKGRLQADSVINCLPVASEILKAIEKAFQMDCSSVVNPYGDGNSAPRIIAALKQITDLQILLKKHFFQVTP